MLDLNTLYKLRDLMTETNYPEEDMCMINDIISNKELILENQSGGAHGAPFSGGVSLGAGIGPISSNQPSEMPGALNGSDWTRGNGKSGSGDISVGYNPSGGNRVFQKLKKPKSMGKDHGPRTGKKSRVKPLSRKMIQTMLKDKGKKAGKIVSFDDFLKKGTEQVTKVKEGRTFQSDRNKKKDDTKYDRKDQMRTNIESHIKSLMGAKIKRVGNDLEILDIENVRVAQIMFRDEYIGIKGSNQKFTDEFSYKDLGKIKSKITNLVNG